MRILCQTISRLRERLTQSLQMSHQTLGVWESRNASKYDDRAGIGMASVGKGRVRAVAVAVACVGAGSRRVRAIISRAQVTTAIPLPTPHPTLQHGNYTPKRDGSRFPVIPTHGNPPIKLSSARERGDGGAVNGSRVRTVCLGG